LKAERAAARAEDRRIMRELVAEPRAKPRPKKSSPPKPRLTHFDHMTATVDAKSGLVIRRVEIHVSRGLRRFARSKRLPKHLLEAADWFDEP
jgi:hypothetical protein